MSRQDTEPPLSLSQRAYVITKSLRAASRILLALVIGILFFNLLAMGALTQIRADIYDISKTFLFIVVLLSIILSSYIVIWFLLKAPYYYSQLEKWDEDYLHSAYILVFDTTIPKGNSTGERILNLAKLVFPELRSDLYTSLLAKQTSSAFMSAVIQRIFTKKKGKSEEEIISESLNQKMGTYPLDLVLKTEKGYFIVKDFKERIITIEDLKELVKVIKSKLGEKDIFRIICVAKGYNQQLLKPETLEQQMKELDANLSIDLLVEENVGYSVLWIS